jgi:hypothetical protein
MSPLSLVHHVAQWLEGMKLEVIVEYAVRGLALIALGYAKSA